MENRALSGAAKRSKGKKKKQRCLFVAANSVHLLIFHQKVRQGDGTDSSGVSTTTAADNASTSITTAGSSLAVAAETGQTELSPVTSPVDEILAAGNEPESAVQQRDDDEDSWCETVTDPALWGNIFSGKVKSVLIERGPSSFTTDEGNILHRRETVD
ncbi:unnamed protein product [Pleuronectes platessa]|uniref:Uncharacterized protein n=1 Tax=Pleuronectes platessa TaxID=8262 RepID=A0A9N7TYY4_PLEPL|nr:unnamed protein product [Pleuronectes platessa]